MAGAYDASQAAAVMRQGPFAQGVESLRQDTAALNQAVEHGDLRISKEGAATLKRALNSIKTEVNNSFRSFEQVTRDLPFGGHDYGQLVSEHTRKLIEGEPDSALTVVKQLLQVLDEAIDTLDLAVQRYEEYEESATNTFSGTDL